MAVSLPLSIMAGISYKASAMVAYKPDLVPAVMGTVQPSAPEPVTEAPAVVPIQAVDNTELQAVLDSWSKTHPKQQWSTVIQGMDGDERSASLNPNTVYDSASIYKLLLMYPLLQKLSVADLKAVAVPVDGKRMTISDCVNLMLRVSNNPCGVAVGNYVGWSAADKKLKDLVSGTNLNRPSGLKTTAADTATLLKDLHSGPAFNDESRQYILGLMKQQVLRKGIPSGCSDCVVANKTGDLGYVRHDAAIVEYPGGVYALSIFTNGASYAQIAELTAQLHAVMSKKMP